jgi:hypothetical protein
MTTLSRRPVIYGLYVVAKGIDNEAAVVIWTVFSPRPGSPIVLPLRSQGGLITRINGGVAWRARQQIYM